MAGAASAHINRQEAPALTEPGASWCLVEWRSIFPARVIPRRQCVVNRAASTFKKGELVELTWEDSAHAPVGWHDADSTLRPVIATSVGFVHRKDRSHVILASERTDSGQVAGLTSIPRSAIRKVRKLR